MSELKNISKFFFFVSDFIRTFATEKAERMASQSNVIRVIFTKGCNGKIKVVRPTNPCKITPMCEGFAFLRLSSLNN